MNGTGDEYRASLRGGRAVYMDDGPVADVTTHPQFKPLDFVRKASDLFDNVVAGRQKVA